MKKLRKMLALLLSLTMILAMGLSVSAEGDGNASSENYSITITNATDGHTYSAYQIFKGDLSNNDDGQKVLSNIEWGKGVNTTTQVEEKTLIEAVRAIGTDFVECSNAKSVAEALESADPATVDAFAAVVAKYTSANAQGTSSNFRDVEEYTISNLEAGYYLVKDALAEDAEGDAVSKFMLEVVGDTKVAPKSSVPSVVKKVKEKNDSTGDTTDWQDAADYDIGDEVPFQLTGTMPSRLGDYTSYSYTFSDTLSKGLTYDKEKVKVYFVPNKENENTRYELNDEVCTVSEANVDSENGNQTFTVTFDNVKSVSVTPAGQESISLTENSLIVVEYTATLNNNAVVGDTGNPNKVSLTYSNNPNAGGENDRGTTPEDKVIVFTYQLTVNKVGEDGETSLTGAGFTLYKKYNTAPAGGTADPNGNEYYAVKTINSTDDSLISSFEFKGLDAGDYKLVETQVPAGYNKAEDIKFTVEATYDTSSDDPKLKNLVIKNANGNSMSGGDGSLFSVTPTTFDDISTTIQNFKGSVLPSTGGIGTTIFYVIGGILMVGAGVLLISRKRTNR